MSINQIKRPSSLDTRQLLDSMIEAREQYSIYLRSVATGQRPPDTDEKELLKSQCDETLIAWKAAHESWKLKSFHCIQTLKKESR